MGHQQLLGQRLGERALVPKEFADESYDQLRDRPSILDIARREAKCQQFPLVMDDQVQLEAVAPADRGLATCSAPGRHLMLVDAWVAADRKRGRVDEADAATAAQVRMQRGSQRNEHRGHQLDEPLVAHQCGKFATSVALDGLGVIRASTFESAIDGTGSPWS